MPTAIIAVGGNSLIKDKQHQSVKDQYSAVVETVRSIVGLIEKGWEVVITHGNGPQVGYILMRSECTNKQLGLHTVPLDSCGADSQGAIGYIFQQVLKNEFEKRGIEKEAVTVVTRVLVDRKDPAFKTPSKPIGPFMDKNEALDKKNNEGWDVHEDAGRGWRRVVPSPIPKKIIEEKAIEVLVREGFCVIGVGGGGVPVYRRKDGIISGLEAVIDKDFSSSLLARDINADMFIISTAVDKVCLNFGQPDEKKLDMITVKEAEKYIKEGQFAPGSMLPKIEAALEYLRGGGKKAVITSPENIQASAEGRAGTSIVP